MFYKLMPFQIYFKAGTVETIKFSSFSIEKLENGVHRLAILNDVGKPTGFLGFDHVAASIPNISGGDMVDLT